MTRIVLVGGLAALAVAVEGGTVQIANEAQKLIASDGMPSDKFGIAIDREGDTLIVGAPQHYTNALPGSFYVFTRDATGHWSEQQRIMSEFKPGQAEFGDLFGEQLALAGNTLLVGAPFTELNGTTLVGTVYVFSRDASGAWLHDQTLLPNDVNITRFGEHMAIADGVVVIGSLYRVFVFARDDSGAWSQQAELTGIPFDIVGPVAFDGQMIVLANGTIPSDDVGAVVYTHSGGQWQLAASITTSVNGTMTRVSDVSLDNSDLALGVIDLVGQDRAFVFTEAEAGTWAEQAMLDPNTLENDSFGSDVALRDDVLLVGANHAGANGITYVHSRDSAGAWGQMMQLMPSDSFAHNFGDEIHFSDSVPIIGSWAHHENGLYAGAVYVFDELPAPVQPGDVTGDGLVNVSDLLAVINAWGPCDAPCPADATGDGQVNVSDLLMVINNWG